MTHRTPQDKRTPRKQERKERQDILSDVLGSYTGMGRDGDVPEQDPDDL